MTTGATPLPLIDAEIVHRERDRASVRLTLSNPPAEVLCRLREHPAVLQVDIDVPSLEEIFVTFLQRGETSESEPVDDVVPSQALVEEEEANG